MKKHLKYIDGNSDKFWQIEVADSTYTVTYGRNGTSGTSQTKSFNDAEECLKAAEKLLNEKVKKGYSETGEIVASASVSKLKQGQSANSQQILEAYDAIIRSRDMSKLLPFLQENAKGNLELLKKHIKKQKQYWMSFIDLSKEPKFIRDNYQWGTRGDDHQKDIIILSAIAVFNKSDIAPWPEAFDFLNKVKADEVLQVLRWAKPTWIAEVLLEREKKEQWRSFNYYTLRLLEDEGLISFNPELTALSLSGINEWQTKVKPRNFIAFICNDERAYTRDVLELFNYETSLHSFRFRDNDQQVWNEFCTWEIIFKQLLTENKIDRKLFIEQSILLQTKEWNNNLKSFFRKRLSEINPTAEDLIPYQELIFAGLQNSNPHIVTAMTELVKKIYEEKKFNVSSFLDWLEPVMMAKDNKTSIKSLLPILEKINKSHPKLNKKITSLIADAFVVPILDLQERASKLLLKIAHKEDLQLKEKLTDYGSLMLGNVRNSLNDLLSDVTAPDIEVANYQYRQQSEAVLTEPVSLPNDWNDVLFLFGKFISSTEVIDLELLLNTYIMQRQLFPKDYSQQLQPYAKQLEKIYFGSVYKDYAKAFLKQKISNINNTFEVKTSPYNKVRTILLVKPYLYAVQAKIARGSTLPMLSFPTHYPNWVAPKALMQRLIAHQESNEEIDKIDLNIAIGRMPREQIEDAVPLLNELKGEIRDLMAFCLGETKTIALKQSGIFNRLLLKLSGTGSALTNVWAVAARTYYPEDSFPEFGATTAKDYPFAVAPFRPKFRFKEKWNEYVNYQTKQKERTPSWYELSFDVGGYKNIPDDYFYALDHYGRKNSWEYWVSGNGDVNYWHSLMPQNADPLSCFLLGGVLRTSNGGGQDLVGFLQIINSKGFKFTVLSTLAFGCTFFNNKKEIRLMAGEVLINLVERQTIGLTQLALAFTFLSNNKYGPFSRLVESIEMLKDVSNLHNSGFFVLIEAILANLEADKLPVNFKRLVEHYIDLMHKTQQKPAPATIAFFEKWQESSSLKALIKQILN